MTTLIELLRRDMDSGNLGDRAADMIEAQNAVGIRQEQTILGQEREIRRLRAELDAALDVVVDLGGEVRLPEIDDARRRRADAERYSYLRNRVPADVLGARGKPAGCWIDCDDEQDGEAVLMLLTGEDADRAIDAAMRETP